VSGQSGVFLVALLNGTPVGCGAVRAHPCGDRRVQADVRGAVRARKWIFEATGGWLEAEARALGAKRLGLETGIRQLAALALYRGAGLQPIPLYGEYLVPPVTSGCLGEEL